MCDVETILGTYFAEHPDASDDEIRGFYQTLNPTAVNHRAQRLDDILSARAKLAALRALPLIPQRSEQWYVLRESLLTASDLAQAIGKGKYGSRKALLEKKAFPSRDFTSATSGPLAWGVRYEQVAAMCYQRMKGGVPLHEFGLIPHPTCKVFGASPDGITDLGVMLEIKCPYSRKIIPGDVPDYYGLQIQGQLEVCDLEYCDYIECILKEHIRDDFAEITDREHVGIVAECYGKGDIYIYSPPELHTPAELLEWARALHAQMPDTIKCFYHWSLEDFNLVRVKRDRELFASLRPQIEDFWLDVIRTRAAGPLPPKAPRASRRAPPEFAFMEETEETPVTAPTGFAFLQDE